MRRTQSQLEDPSTQASNNVRVVLRVRPLLPSETGRGEGSAASVLPDGQTVLITVNPNNVSNPAGGGGGGAGGLNRKAEAQRHSFDAVFGSSTSQRDLFHQSGVEALCDAALEGMSNTVFCFGQTGSGKTYTMSGPAGIESAAGEELALEATGGNHQPNTLSSDSHAGLQYRAAHYIASSVAEYNRVHGTPAFPTPLTMSASFLEVYNESINDLLNETQNLKARWSQSAQAFFVEQLMIVQCDHVDDLLAVLQEGNNNRKRASHLLNVDSTRSHVMFTVYLERRDAPNAPKRFGKIHFVDLAGSERLKDSESSGVNSVETRAINKSLFTLGKVIAALAKGTTGSGNSFVPYRDSTLTKLLMDSLGGNSHTLMVACITPSDRFVEESLQTLQYAQRTRNIVNANPTVRMDPKQVQLYTLRLEVEMLRNENRDLKKQLLQQQGGGGGEWAENVSSVASSMRHPLTAGSSGAPSAFPPSSPLTLQQQQQHHQQQQQAFRRLSNHFGVPPGTANSTASAPPVLNNIGSSQLPQHLLLLQQQQQQLTRNNSFTSFLAMDQTNATSRSLPPIPSSPQMGLYNNNNNNNMTIASSLSTHQHAEWSIALKAQKDNEELRKEVSMLRTMLLEMKQQQQQQQGGGGGGGVGSSRMAAVVPYPPEPASSPKRTVPPPPPPPPIAAAAVGGGSGNAVPSSGEGGATEGSGLLSDFGFRPAPKKIQRINFFT